MSFTIRITGDTRSAETGVERLVGKLEAAETAGARVGSGIELGATRGRDALGRFASDANRATVALDALARASGAASRGATGLERFGTVGRYTADTLGQVAAASFRGASALAVLWGNAAGAATEHGRLVSGLGRAGLAFEGVAAAIQREQAMLEAIRGPTQRFTADLETLNSLARRGAITLEEYRAQASKLSSELARSKGGPAGGGGGGGGGGMNLLAAGKGALLSAAAAYGAREVLDAANAYQEMQNKLRAVASEGESVSATFGRMRDIATATRSSVEATTSAYVRFRAATREMSLSSAELDALTTRVNKSVQLSGPSASEASAGVMQLGQALSSGRLQGDEFRSIMENLPYVAQVLTQALGVTRGKLREMSSEGKLTASVVVGAFQKMGASIDRDFAKTVPTLGQQWTMLKDQITVAIGKLFESTGLFKTIGMALDTLSFALEFVGHAFDAARVLSDGLREALGPLGEAILYITNPLGLLKDALGWLADAGTAIGEYARDSGMFTSSSLLMAKAIGDVEDGATDLTSQLRAMQAQAEATFDPEKASKLAAEMSELKAINEGLGYSWTRFDAARYLAAKRVADEQERIAKLQETARFAAEAGIELPKFDQQQYLAGFQTRNAILDSVGFDVGKRFEGWVDQTGQLQTAIEKINADRAAKKFEEAARRGAEAARGWRGMIDENEEAITKLNVREREATTVIRDAAAMRALVWRQAGGDAAARIERSRLELNAERALRDVQLEKANSDRDYGAVVVRVRKEEYERRDAVDDLTRAMKHGDLTVREYLEQLGKLGKPTGPLAMADQIAALEAAVAKARGARGVWLDPPTRAEVEAQRQLRDLKIEAQYADKVGGDLAVKNRTELAHRADAIADLKAQLKDGGITAKFFAEQMRALADSSLPTVDVLKQLRDPLLTYSITVGQLNALFRAGKIDAQQYAEQLAKAAAAVPTRTGELPRGAGLVGPRRMGGQDLAIGYDAEPAAAVGNTPTAVAPTSGIEVKYLAETDALYRLIEAKRAEIDATRLNATERQRELAAIEARNALATAGARITDENVAALVRETAAAKQADAERKVLEEVRAPLYDYARGLQTVYRLHADGRLTAAEYTAEVARLKQELASANEKTQAQKGSFAAMLDEVTRASDGLAGVVSNAIGSIEDAFVAMATGAETSWRKMIDAMIADLTRLMFREGVNLLLGALKGGGGGGGEGIASGIAAVNTIFDLPAFAHGGSWMVGGAPGIDRNVVAFRASAGERVTVEPRGGRSPAGGGDGGGAPVSLRIVNVSDESRMRAFMESSSETYVLNSLRRHAPALRGRLTGR
jgi:tape measure domain-containing protein